MAPATFGPFSRPYRERYRADPFSREYVRHILGWYAQKHPDEDFAETFAVWLTPGSTGAREYAGWPALAKLEYVDRVMREIRDRVAPTVVAAGRGRPAGRGDELHGRRALRRSDDRVPIEDARQFDGDLRGIFVTRRRTRRRANRRSGSSIGTIARSCRESRTGRARAPSVVRIADRPSRAPGRRARSARRRARGVDADRAHGVRHGGGHEPSLHTHARPHVASGSRAERSEPHEDRRCCTQRDALEPPVDPVLGQLTRRVARARARGRHACRSTADVRAARRRSCRARSRISSSTSPSRSAERARSSRTSPALLNLLDLRYTGSSPGGLLSAGDKSLTKKVLRFTAFRRRSSRRCIAVRVDWAGDLTFPGDREAAAGRRVARHHVGVGRARDQGSVRAIDELQTEYQAPVLVEQFIEGREFYVGVLGNANAEALPVIELDFSGFPADRPRIASWAAKWGDDGDGQGAEFAGTQSIFPDESGRRARRANAEGRGRQRSTRFGCATTRASTFGSPTPARST